MLDGGTLDISKGKFASPVSAVHLGRGGKLITGGTNPAATIINVELRAEQPIRLP